MTNRIIGTVSLATVQPIAFTHHGIEGQPLMTRGDDAEGRPLRTVFLPASQLRGRIRHEAAMAALHSKGAPVKLEEAYLAALGQDLRPEEDRAEELVRLREQQVLREAQPLLDLFGTWKVASRLKVGHLLPDVNVAPDSFSIIRRDLDSNEELMNLLPDEEQDRFYARQDSQSMASKVDGMIKVAERELRAAKKAKNEALTAELTQKLEELKTAKQSHKGDDESSNSKHLLSVEAIPAGVNLSGRWVIERARPRDLDVIVAAFDGLSRRPVMGAATARGCGEVSGAVVFSDSEGEVLLRIKFGQYTPAIVEWTVSGKAFMTPAQAA